VENWLSNLNEGQSQLAWDLFVERYRRLMLATIRRMIRDHDDVMDVFSNVCQALSANDFARLRRYSDRASRGASVATWLVVVVRNQAVDWLRQEEGRRRLSVPTGLAPVQAEIYTAICIDGCSHVEAFETIRARGGTALTFHEFLREVRATHRIAPCPGRAAARRMVRGPPSETTTTPSVDPAEAAESAHRIRAALAAQAADVRLAVELFVVDRAVASDVARAVGWPNAKAVYNRVYRALAAIREALARDGIGPGDL
jgi:RNA polymerase sigma factor (sigma-70 family)